MLKPVEHNAGTLPAPVPAGLIDDAASLREALAHVWSPGAFSSRALNDYAAPHILSETRRGVALMSLSALLYLTVAAMLSSLFGLGASQVYTFSVLAALALHIYLCSGRMNQVAVLHLLAMLLLVVCGSSVVLLVQQSGQLSTMHLLSVAVLFMLVPVVPWGLREAAFTTGAIYLMFTASTSWTRVRFSQVDLWVLQLLMLMAALVSLVLVARALGLRKHDLAMRFEIEEAHAQVADLADRDHLTGARNRRFLERDFERAVAAHRASGRRSYFGLFDIDRFKTLNDTLGHRRGDDVLQAVARSFEGLEAPHEYLVRLGGDEFALMMSGPEVQQRIADALASLASFANAAGDKPVAPAVSLGLLCLPAGEPALFEDAYKQADDLLYAAKRDGGSRIRQRIDDISSEHLLGKAQ